MKQLNKCACSILCLAVLTLSACASTPTESHLTAKNQYGDDVFELSSLADRAYRESRWVDAARHYQQLTEKVPNDAYMWFRLANTYVQKGSFNQAIHAYEESISRDSMQPKPWFNLSTTYLMSAKAALLQSWQNLRPSDPARAIIRTRIDAIDTLMSDGMHEVRATR